jgi:hypothetical protein
MIIKTLTEEVWNKMFRGMFEREGVKVKKKNDWQKITSEYVHFVMLFAS